MKYIAFTEFRNHSKFYFDDIEKGQTYVIIRKGKPIAEIGPFRESIPGWKRKRHRVRLKGKVSILDMLLEERAER